MFKKNAAMIVTISIFAVILLGQTLAYFAVPYKYDASAYMTEDGIDFTLSTNSSVSYAVLAYDNARPVKALYIYYDESYAALRITHESQQRLISDMIVELRIRGFTDVNMVNAEELSDIVSSGYVKGDAIFISSGVLPDTVYRGHTDEGIFKWVSDGGSLYWAGYAIGAAYAKGKEIVNVPGFQQNIFGAGNSILMSSAVSAERSADGGGLSKALMLPYNVVTYGLNVGAIPGALSLGFNHVIGTNVFSSISLAEYGEGMISVMGRTNIQSSTAAAQLIATGVSPTSTLIWMDEGSLVRGSAEGTISELGENIGVQIRMGDPNVVYARTFFFV